MEARVKNIEDLFGSPISYRIPPFQRPYCWDRERQWEPLWEDIIQLANRRARLETDPSPHFMGAIVLQQGDSATGEVDKRLVIDGQQRLVTMQIILKAAADVFDAKQEVDRAARLQEMTRNDMNRSGNDCDNLVKVRPTHKGDRASFQAIMHGKQEEDSLFPKIRDAYGFFLEKIRDWLEDNSLFEDREKRSEFLEKVLSRHLQIASIDLEKADEPYSTFATLNDRGENLGSADLIKNMLMQQAKVGEDEDKADSVWGHFEKEPWWHKKTQENNLPRMEVDRFLDHWLTIQMPGVVRKPLRLPADFNNYLKNQSQNKIEEVVSDLKRRSALYMQIQKGEIAGVELSLKRMHALKIGAPMAMMLWLFSSAEVNQPWREFITKAIESYIVRRKIMQLPTNGLPKLFANLIAKVAIAKPSEIPITVVNFISNHSSNTIWPENKDFERQLGTEPLVKDRKSKQIVLAAIELHLRSPKMEQLGDTSKLTLEHIMPVKWQKSWPLESRNLVVDREVRKRKVDFIGNLTLVTQKLNSSFGNKTWQEKKSELKNHSILVLNKSLLEDAPEVWNEAAIDRRSKEMAKIALEIWPGPEEFKKQQEFLTNSETQVA